MNNLADFIGIARFSLTQSQIRRIHGSDTMTEPRSYYRTRGATKVAEWCKARRLDRLVATVKNTRLSKFFLGGGPAFPELSPELATRLYDLFRPEMEALEAILQRDLTAWKIPDACLSSIPVSA